MIEKTYLGVDVAQDRQKGLAMCLLTDRGDGPLTIRYYHQMYLHTHHIWNDIPEMVGYWPTELTQAAVTGIDSPLWFAQEDAGRQIDQIDTWPEGYLNNPPQHSPTREEAKRVRDNGMGRCAWILAGMALKQELEQEPERILDMRIIEIYPTPSFNALHHWPDADRVRLFSRLGEEPHVVGSIQQNATVDLPLRYLERLRLHYNQENRFRKLSNWPYLDLWDALGAAITCWLFDLDETINIEVGPQEGRITVPRLNGW